MNTKQKLIKALKTQLPHSISDFALLAPLSGGMVPERHPPTIVLDKVGTKRKSFAVRSMDMTNKRGFDFVDVDVPVYKPMHGSQYVKKHKKRLERDWNY